MNTSNKKTILISVFNKTGVIDFARTLAQLGWNILASKGTAAALNAEGIPATDIATIVGEPLLGHRVVTLSREIHAGLLAVDNENDRAELERNNIPFIDALYCNFYPLQEAIEAPDATVESVIEKTDIGGPTMVRSASKGQRYVITTGEGAESFLQHLIAGCPDDQKYKRRMAANGERLVSRYCALSANYQANGDFLIEIDAVTEEVDDSSHVG